MKLGCVRKSGEIRDVSVSAEVIEMAGQQYALGLTHDITEHKRAKAERKKLEAQLFQAQKMESVGRLAGGVAHDFNNMLGVIIGRAEMALEQDVPTDKLRHHLKEILKAGLRSADLTRQLLAFARKQTAVPKILDLNDTISGMLKMLRRLIGEDIELSLGTGTRSLESQNRSLPGGPDPGQSCGQCPRCHFRGRRRHYEDRKRCDR